MKKLSLFLFITLSLFSCSRQKTCTCTDSNGNVISRETSTATTQQEITQFETDCKNTKIAANASSSGNESCKVN